MTLLVFLRACQLWNFQCTQYEGYQSLQGLQARCTTTKVVYLIWGSSKSQASGRSASLMA